MCVCDLMKAIRVGQSLVSFHLKVLKGAGLITDRRSGRWVYYSIVPGALARLGELLARDGRLATRTMEDDSQ
jgi:ArsR family transcriptional regulator